MVVQNTKRKSMPTTPKTPNNFGKKPAPGAASPASPNKKAKFENNKEKKFTPKPKSPGAPQNQSPQKQQNTPKKFEKSPGGGGGAEGKTPQKMKIDVVASNGKQNPLKKIDKKDHPIQKQKNKPAQANSPNKNGKPGGKDFNKKGNKKFGKTDDAKNKKPEHKKGKKNRYQRLQQKLSEKVSTEESRARALKLEQDLAQEKGRLLTIRLPDETISQESIRKWSGAIENAIFPKPIEPRTFLVVLKPKSNIKKEIENLKKISFGGGKITVEERNDFEIKAFSNASAIDPFTLYITNLSMDVTREDLTQFFPQSDNVMNPRKHNPGKTTGNLTKFAFVSFKTTDDALENLKEKYNAELKGTSMVMRFRRVQIQNPPNSAKTEENAKAGKAEVAKGATPAKADAKKAATPAKQDKKTPAKNATPARVKQEVKQESDDDDEDDDDEEEDDDEDVEDEEGPDGLAIAAEEDDDDDDDDEEEDDDDDDDDDDDLGEESEDDSE